MKRIYISILSKSMRSSSVYRMNTVLTIFLGIISLIVQAFIWKSLYEQGHYQDSTLSQALTYTVASTIILSKLHIYPGISMSKSIYNGQIGVDLIRPVSFTLMYTFQELGKSLFRFMVSGIPLVIFAVITFDILPPKNLSTLLVSISSAILGIIILTLIDCILGYTAFWMTANWYIPKLENALMVLFGGITLPIWFYPKWLINICNVLPFKYINYEVINIYLGRTAIENVYKVILMQLVWILLLTLVERVVWSISINNVVVQGG